MNKRIYHCVLYGEVVDLDDPKTYDYLPNSIKDLDDLMFKHIGYAIMYITVYYPNWDENQKQRINEKAKYFAENRIQNFDNIMWFKEQVFLFEEEIENLC